MQRTDTEWAKLALSLMDLTTLNDNDTHEIVAELCKSANTDFGHPAAICIYDRFVERAQKSLKQQGIDAVRVATVANFPHGNTDIDAVVTEINAQVQSHADEVDVVFPYKAFIEGDHVIAGELVAKSKLACGDKKLKVIIESGELKTPELIKAASEVAIAHGADFIKTSTGKVAVNATLEAAEVMLNSIKDSGKNVGFKAAGGVKTVEDAKAYLQLAERIMGDNWITADTFRFGASGLLNSLLATLNNQDVADNNAEY